MSSPSLTEHFGEVSMTHCIHGIDSEVEFAQKILSRYSQELDKYTPTGFETCFESVLMRSEILGPQGDKKDALEYSKPYLHIVGAVERIQQAIRSHLFGKEGVRLIVRNEVVLRMASVSLEIIVDHSVLSDDKGSTISKKMQNLFNMAILTLAQSNCDSPYGEDYSFLPFT